MGTYDYKLGSIVKLDIPKVATTEWVIIRHIAGHIRAVNASDQSITISMKAPEFNNHVLSVIAY